jgi:molybdate transport system ATP-binding protein
MFSIKVKKELHSSQGNIMLDLDLQIEQGKFISIFGKSGAGKTTLLKMLAGLVLPEQGLIESGNEIWFNKDKRIDVIPQRRKIGFVFQDYALFPNMTVRENLEFVLPSKKNRNRVNELLDIMGLAELSFRYSATLSGGQQQRVALARALVREPELLLLDEPLSSLDHETRIKLQEEIMKIHRHFGLTTILISHDPSELYRLSDFIFEMDFGKIVRQGTPAEIFRYKEISGKVQLMGEILEVVQNDIVFIVKIISGNNLIKVMVTKQEASELQVGDKVLITSKAFNPVLIKLQ